MAIYSVRYKFQITNTDIGTEIIPIENFSARIREGDQDSYLQVTIPDFPTYQDTLMDYLDTCRHSVMTVSKSIGTGSYTDILTVDVEDLSLEDGAKTSSIVLTGHRAFWNTAPTTRTLVSVDYIKTGLDDAYSTVYRLRCSPANLVNASDTVQYTSSGQSYSFVATLVSHTQDSIEVSNGD